MTDTISTFDSEEISEAASRQLAKLATRVDRQNEALQDKDEIIGALTERLEQAAEQLDRLKRSGADRGPRGVPTEMFAAQEAMRADIESIADQFEGLDLGASFYRLELLMNEVRDLVIHAPPVVAANAQETTNEIQSSETSDEPDASATDEPLAPSDWDAIKRQLLGDDNADAGENQTAEIPRLSEDQDSGDIVEMPVEVAPLEEAASENPPENVGEYKAEPLPADLPEPVDLEFAEREDLIEALEVRDKYISVLTRRLEDRHSRLTVPTDWDAIATAPEALVSAVQRLHDELTDAVRTAEVDICLERARLSRERTKLEKLSETIDAAQENEESPAKVPPARDQSQRWRRMLGIKDED